MPWPLSLFGRRSKKGPPRGRPSPSPRPTRAQPETPGDLLTDPEKGTLGNLGAGSLGELYVDFVGLARRAINDPADTFPPVAAGGLGAGRVTRRLLSTVDHLGACGVDEGHRAKLFAIAEELEVLAGTGGAPAGIRGLRLELLDLYDLTEADVFSWAAGVEPA